MPNNYCEPRDDPHIYTDNHSFLRTCFSSAPRIEFGNGFLGGGGGPSKEQRWTGNLGLKGAGMSVESIAVELQCTLLTLALLQPREMGIASPTSWVVVSGYITMNIDCQARLVLPLHASGESEEWVTSSEPRER